MVCAAESGVRHSVSTHARCGQNNIIGHEPARHDEMHLQWRSVEAEHDT